jgi:hypothetical protein
VSRVRRLFLGLLGGIYGAAFASLWVQLDGLVGSHGLLPAADFLAWVHEQAGPERYWLLPTLCWWSASDGFLHFLCASGVVLSLLLVLDVAPALVLPLLWAFYLSLVTVGQIFLGYQWDALLLETGLLAVLLAPLRLRPGASEAPPSPIAVWLLRWLLFRLMFSSGFVKLASGDPSWRGLTALRFHYETQPLPTWIGWYAHQLPVWFQTFSCAVMFAIELGVPFLIFAPRRFRLAAFGPLVGLQLLIGATGNYAFFNLLTIALCLLLLDDAALPRRWRGGEQPAGGRSWPRPLLIAVTAPLGLVSGMTFLGTLGVHGWPSALVPLYRLARATRSINGYGLFAVMTTTRPEIVIEGSDNGVEWKAYGFRWKPGDPERAPAFVEPHQPRLDWQLWFAALETCDDNPWVIRLLQQIRQGSPEALGLLGTNPFPSHPPRRVRAMLYDYRFTDFGERRSRGAWWRRERNDLYCRELPSGEVLP